MTSVQFPRPTEPFLDRSGLVTRWWYDYLRTLTPSDLSAELQAQVAANSAAIAALQEGGGTAGNIVGLNSVFAYGSLADGTVWVQLQGDAPNPGPTYYYGTGQDGERGWYTVASAVEAEAGELSKSVGADGVTTFGLADVTPITGGTLHKTAFDAKGRRSEEDAATTDDLTEGVTNLYYTDSRADARITLQKGQPNGLATLDADAKLEANQLPALAITETFVEADEAGMLALDAQQGDVCVRTDEEKSYILTAEPASTLGNWQELLTPTGTGGTVTSVGLSVPTGFTASGGPITSSGTLTMSYASGYQGYTTAEASKLAGVAAGATANTGTVMSVGLSVPTGFAVSGSPVTGSGTLVVIYASGYQGYSSTEASKLSGIATGATVGATWGMNLGSIPANITSWAAIAPSTKEGVIASGTTAQYWRGDKTWRSFADDVRSTYEDGALVYPSVAPQIIPSGVNTAIAMGNVTYDDSGYFNVSNPTRLTVQVDGRYRVSFSARFQAQTGGTRIGYVQKNGLDYPGRPALRISPSGAVDYVSANSSVIECVAGDYFELFMGQSSGVNVSMSDNSGTGTWLSIQRVA